MFARIIRALDRISDPFFDMMNRTLSVSKWSLRMRRGFLLTIPLSGCIWILWAVTCTLIVLIMVLIVVVMTKVDELWNAQASSITTMLNK